MKLFLSGFFETAVIPEDGNSWRRFPSPAIVDIL